MKRNHSKRSFVATITTLSVVALLLVGMTLAFLTDSRSTLNILGIGSGDGGGGRTKTIQIALLEEAFGSTPDSDAIMAAGEERLPHEYEMVRLNNLLPGDEINKDSIVRNVGRKDVYVRVQLLDNAGNPVNFASDLYSKLELTINDDWKEQVDENGNVYFYYAEGNECKELLSGQEVAVFKEEIGSENKPYTIKIDESVTNSDLIEFGNNLAIKVVAEAIQADNFYPQIIADNVDVWNGQEIQDIAGNVN